MKLTEGGKELVSKNLIYPMLHISNGSLLGKPSIHAANKLRREELADKELADKERIRIGEYKLCKM